MNDSVAPEVGKNSSDEARTARRWRFRFLGAALALTAWGLMGVLGGNEGFTDALFQPDYTIAFAPPGGPLAEAGFHAGDSVLSVEGIPVVELGMYSRWPRPLSRAPGESITMVVEREGERVSGEIVYRERSPGSRKMQFGGLLVGLSFLWFGVWALFVTPSPHALRFAVMGLALGIALPGPSLGSWNGIRDHLQVAGMVLWTLMMLRFFLFFPTPKRRGTGRIATSLLFAPWGVLLGCLVVELVFHPRFYHTFGPLYGLLMTGYAVLALAALIHTLAKTPRNEIRASGMGWVLGGVGIALGSILLWFVLALLPSLAIPGSNWLPVLIAAIPTGMALGVRKHAAQTPRR